MRLKLEFRGQKYDIYAIVRDDGSCPFDSFLERLKKENAGSYKSMVSTLRRHSDSGPITSVKKSRQIEGHGKLWEFKTRQGDRLLYFYMPGGRTVLVHGFHKGKPSEAEVEFEKAARLRDQYLALQG